jgi:hypothetical protein
MDQSDGQLMGSGCEKADGRGIDVLDRGESVEKSDRPNSCLQELVGGESTCRSGANYDDCKAFW